MGYEDDMNDFMRVMGKKIKTAFWLLKSCATFLGEGGGAGKRKKKSGGEVEIFTE